MLVTTKQFKEFHERMHDMWSDIVKKETEFIKKRIVVLEAENDMLQRRIKSLETELLSLDEDFVTHKRAVKVNLINIAQKAKLKPKDLVTFDKKFQDFYGKVEDLAEETLTSLE